MKTLLLLLLPVFACAQADNAAQFAVHQTAQPKMDKLYTYLALGDSYTIGEAVELRKNFPYQTVQLLRSQGHLFYAPEIIARTGWTTDELQDTMRKYQFLKTYDFVTLLIGVNNQYRGSAVSLYKEHFEQLLKRSISLANGDTSRVMAVSIPDYSVTPFVSTADKPRVSRGIDEYNALAKTICGQYNVRYIEITEGSRKAKTDASLIASDGLHPSAKEYTRWARKVAAAMAATLKK